MLPNYKSCIMYVFDDTFYRSVRDTLKLAAVRDLLKVDDLLDVRARTPCFSQDVPGMFSKTPS